MNDPLPSQGRCPDCGAENALSATKCWMCGRTSWMPATSAAQSLPAAETVAPETALPERRSIYQTALAVAVLSAIVTTGIWLHSNILGLLMVVLIDLPLVMTISSSLIREARFRATVEQFAQLPPGAERPPVTIRPMTGVETVGTFLKWVFVLAGSMLFMAGVAAIIIAVMLASLIAALGQICSQCGPR